MRVDALAERIDTTEREIDDERHHIWTKKLHVSKLGDVKLVIAQKEPEEDEENPVKYLATNKIDAPTDHLIRSYSKRWRIETFPRTRSRISALETTRYNWTKVPVATGTF